MLEKSRQLNAYSLVRKHAQGMAEDQRETFLQPHLAQGQQFLEARPSQSSLSHGSSSQATSATSLTAEASVPIVPPATVERFSFFGNLRGHKRRKKRKASMPAANPATIS
jgi:hypothetical protein